MILTSDEMIWSFQTWRRTIPLLNRRWNVVGIGLVPERLGHNLGIKIIIWYIRNFGVYASLILVMFALKQRLLLFGSHLNSWDSLAHFYHLDLFRAPRVNDGQLIRWLRRKNPHCGFIMVGEMLGRQILATSKFGYINKHAGLLPSCRGVFPFLWATIHQLALGVTLHVVTPRIDAGRILIQERVPYPNGSMIKFYLQVFQRFPRLAVAAVDRLIKGDFMPPDKSLKSSYFSYPTRQDVGRFRRHGGRLIDWGDLFT